MDLKNLYWRASASGRDLLHRLDNLAKHVYCPLQQWRNNGVYAVDIEARVGFFAQMNWCLYVFAHAERNGLIPHVALSSPFYTLSKGDNVLDYFFEPRAGDGRLGGAAPNRTFRISRITDIAQTRLSSAYAGRMTLAEANRLLRKYLALKDDIRTYVDAFADTHFAGRRILGVHYRGTDKSLEASPVPWDFCEQTIRNYLARHPGIDGLFVASDETPFIDWIESRFPDLDVSFHADTERSRNRKAIHTTANEGNNYMKGKEALVNCLLLSRCSALIRTASFLSGWASVFNPALPVVLMNKPYRDKLWFPDAHVARISLDEYLPSAGDVRARRDAAAVGPSSAASAGDPPVEDQFA